jgi:hypothetical protein
MKDRLRGSTFKEAFPSPEDLPGRLVPNHEIGLEVPK